MVSTHPKAPYDAVLMVSFGGPEAPEEVLPFLRSVTAGKGIPDERLREVGEHYYSRGGISPIQAECRALVVALQAELPRHGCELPVLWGNRHTQPHLAEVLAEASRTGHQRILAFFTSAFPSYSGCRQYRENLAAALQEAAVPELTVDVAGPLGDLPAWAQVMAQGVHQGWRELIEDGCVPERIATLYVTHSIPEMMNAASGPAHAGGGRYVSAQEAALEEIHGRTFPAGPQPHHRQLVYCSRSGPPHQPWLAPDINEAIEQAAHDGFCGVVAVPLGFVSDHMEVVYDLDEEAAATAKHHGVRYRRTPTVRDDATFVQGLAARLAAMVQGSAWPRIPAIAEHIIRANRACYTDCCRHPRHAAVAVGEVTAT